MSKEMVMEITDDMLIFIGEKLFDLRIKDGSIGIPWSTWHTPNKRYSEPRGSKKWFPLWIASVRGLDAVENAMIARGLFPHGVGVCIVNETWSYTFIHFNCGWWMCHADTKSEALLLAAYRALSAEVK